MLITVMNVKVLGLHVESDAIVCGTKSIGRTKVK